MDKEQNKCDLEWQPSVSDGALCQQAQDQYNNREHAGDSDDRPIAKGGVNKPVESQQEQADSI